MKEKPVILIRGIDPSPHMEERFNKWYNETHIPLLLKFKKLKKATRYKRVGEDNKYPKYIAVYEFNSLKDFEEYEKSPELAAAGAERNQSWPKPEDYQQKWRVQYEYVESWKR